MKVKEKPIVDILYVCNFNSPHSRSLIKYFAQIEHLRVSVLSTYQCDHMNNVDLFILNNQAMNEKSRLVSILARYILKLSRTLFIKLSAYNRNKVTLRLLEMLGHRKFLFAPDIVHALRTQPEGIVALEVVKKYGGKFVLTTWGQDFVLWAGNNAGLKTRTQSVVNRLNFVFPDNPRDNDILRSDYSYQGKALTIPAIGGLEFERLDTISAAKETDQYDYTFLSNRGYENTYVKVELLIQAFSVFQRVFPNSHFYIDVHSVQDPVRDAPLQKWISAHNLEEKISVLHLNSQEAISYMKLCDFYVSCTTSDGLPISLLECLYLGQVPIVYRHDSTMEVEEDFPHFFSYKKNSAQEIGKLWIEAAENKANRAAITKVNQAIIRSKYSRESNLRKVLNSYEYLLPQ